MKSASLVIVCFQILWMCVGGLTVGARPTLGKGPGMFPLERTGEGFACQYTERKMPNRSLKDWQMSCQIETDISRCSNSYGKKKRFGCHASPVNANVLLNCALRTSKPTSSPKRCKEGIFVLTQQMCCVVEIFRFWLWKMHCKTNQNITESQTINLSQTSRFKVTFVTNFTAFVFNPLRKLIWYLFFPLINKMLLLLLNNQTYTINPLLSFMC